VRQRLATYAQQSAPLKEHYRNQGTLQVFSGTESDAIYPLVKAHLEGLNLETPTVAKTK
jgi:adenylate kinase family enzyme